jgi:hypothetical protein
MNNNYYEEYLKISDEVTLEVLMKKLGIALLDNEVCIYKNTAKENNQRMLDLYLLVMKLQELLNIAIAHNNQMVVDRCIDCITEAEGQMARLRTKYFKAD